MQEKYCQKLVKNIYIFLGILLPTFFLFASQKAYALSTDTINLQGKIVRNDTGYEGLNVSTGNPSCVVDGASNDTCDFRVRYYSASSGGTLFLTEVFSNKEIGQYNGAFNLSLGSDVSPTAGSYTSLDEMIMAEDEIYVEISFDPAGGGSYTEVFTRMPLQATAFAMRSKYASEASTAFKFQNAADASGYSTPSAGMVYFDTTDTTLKVYDGASWVDIGSGTGSSLWTDDGLFTYLTNLTDHLVLGADSYTAIGSDNYATYMAGLGSRAPLSFDMGAERLTLSGDQAKSGLTVYSGYTSTGAWPLVSFKAEDSGFDNLILELVQDGTGNLLSMKKGSTEVFAFENAMTFFIRPRDDGPTVYENRLYNVGGTLYWNGSAVGGGGSSLWTDAGTYTYLTDDDDDVIIGGTNSSTAAFYFDVANGRLGIGTGAPSSTLDIAGASSVISNSAGDITIRPNESLIIKAQTTDPNNLTEWQNSSGTVLSLINQSGYASFGKSTGSTTAMLSLGANTSGVAQLNLAASSAVDVSSPNTGDLWYNGTNLYFYDGTDHIDLLVGNSDGVGLFSEYGSVDNGSYLNVAHNDDTYSILADGWICVGGGENASCTGGNWKNIKEESVTIRHALMEDWEDAGAEGIIRTDVRDTSVSLSPAFNPGTGSDGDVTVQYNTNINTTSLIAGRSCADGGDAVNYNITAFTSSTTATLSSAPSVGCLAVGDEVLIINLQGTYTAMDNVGNYETLEISDVTGTTVTFKTAKKNYYGDGLTDDTNLGVIAGTQRVMLQRVPQYRNLTVESGINFYPSAWNGVKGGVIFFRASVSANINGYVNADSLGYRGSPNIARGGAGGEAYCGPGGVAEGGNGAAGAGGGDSLAGGNGSCGGGGGTYSSITGLGSGSVNKGGSGGGGSRNTGSGGGAGYGTAGNKGLYGNAQNGGTNSSGNGANDNAGSGGGGGGTYGSADLSKLMMGSAGGTGADNTTAVGGKGGNGGGIVAIYSNTVVVSGEVRSSGEKGGDSTAVNYGGGGGGGAGGSVLLGGKVVNTGSSKVSVSGGSPSFLFSGSLQSAENNGGDGRIAIYYSDSYSGTTANPSVTNYYQSGYNSYGIYNSPVIATPNAQTYDNIRWSQDLDTYGNISIQTRSGGSTNPLDGTWEEWRPYTTGTNYLMLESADTHTKWVGTNATISEGDITRNVDYFEDEDEEGLQSVVIDSYSQTNYTGTSHYVYGTNGKQGQSFTGDGNSLESVEFYLKKTGTPTGNGYVKIYSHSGTYGTSSTPNTLLATSDPLDVSSIGTDFSLIDFTFSGANKITLNSGTYYVAIFENTNGDISNRISIAADSSSPTHGGNWVWNNGTWQADSGYDVIFYVNSVIVAGATKITSSTSGGYAGATITSADLSNYDYITAWVRASQIGNTLRLGFGESAGTEQYEDITIDASDTWQKVYWDISDIATADRDAVTKLRLTNQTSSSNTIYLDNVRAEKLVTENKGSDIASTPNEYMQYRVIFTTTDLAYQPILRNITISYNSGYQIVIYDNNNVRLYNHSGGTKYLKLDVATSGGAGGGTGTGFVAGVATSTISDGEDAVAFTFNTPSSYSNPSSKLLSVMNNSVEKMYLDANGNLYVSGSIIAGNGFGGALVNNSGGVVTERSLVTIDPTANNSFTTTTVENQMGAFGVMTGVNVNGDINKNGVCDDGDTCMVVFEGVTNVTTTNASTTSVGDYIFSSTDAGSAKSSSEQGNGLIGVVTSIADAGSGYVKMVFNSQNKVTADLYMNIGFDKNAYRDMYTLLAKEYEAMTLAERRGVIETNQSETIMFDTFLDGLKIDSTNSDVGLDIYNQKMGLWGGLSLTNTTTDLAGNRYFGSSSASLLEDSSSYYDRVSNAGEFRVKGKAMGVSTNGYIHFDSDTYNSSVIVTEPIGSESGKRRVLGYAWSEDIGWINFTNSSTYQTYILPNGRFTGNAYVPLTGESLEFDENSSNVAINLETGVLYGNLWSDDIGWITFDDQTTRLERSLGATLDSNIDPYWYQGVSLISDTDNMSPDYNGALLKVSGMYGVSSEHGYIDITVKSTTVSTLVADIVSEDGTCSVSNASLTFGNDYSFVAGSCSGSSIKINPARAEYVTGDTFRVASWYTEPATTNDRGSKREFPERALILATNTTTDIHITIVDYDTQRVWMKLSADATALATSNMLLNNTDYDITSVHMVDGYMYISFEDESSSNASKVVIDFARDRAFAYKDEYIYLYDGSISSREDGDGYGLYMFADGLETGDTSNWTYTESDSYSSMSTQMDIIRNGSYAQKFSLTADEANSRNAFLRKDLNSALTEYYTSFYIYLPLDFDGSAGYWQMLQVDDAAWDVRATLLISNYDYIGINVFDSAQSMTNTTDTTILTRGVWHKVELYEKIDDTYGSYTVWLDGEEIISATNVDTGTDGAQYFEYGSYWSWYGVEDDIYMDDISIYTESDIALPYHFGDLSNTEYTGLQYEVLNTGLIKGIDTNAEDTTGAYYSSPVTFASNSNKAYMWMNAYIDSDDVDSDITVSVSNDNGSTYVEGNLIRTAGTILKEYEYSFDFDSANNEYIVKIELERATSKKSTIYVTDWGLAQMDISTLSGNGIYTASEVSVANGEYVEVVHGQNTFNILATGWVYNTTLAKWVRTSDSSVTVNHGKDSDWLKDPSVTVIPGTAGDVDSGSGSDGSITVTTNTNINRTSLITGRSCADGGDAVNYNITAFNVAGNEATLNRAPSTGCLASGDEVLIINLQGSYTSMDNVGNWEVLTIDEVVGTTVTFTTTKTKYYGNNLDDDTNLGTTANTQRVMLQRVPQYEDVTVNASINFYPDEWATESAENATYRVSKGGVMFFKASGSVSINGTIHATGKGYQGGTQEGGYDSGGGQGGEAFCGVGGDGAITTAGGDGASGGGTSTGDPGDGYCGGGGGGGAAGGSGSANYGGAGGGGGRRSGGGAGGYGTAGTSGTYNALTYGAEDGGTNSSGDGGSLPNYGPGGGGGTYGDEALSKLMFGSGGGRGGNNATPQLGGAGGDGGGVVYIVAGSVTVSGGLASNGVVGGNGASGTSYYTGAGGGGAGGAVRIDAGTVNIGPSKVTVTGGASGVGRFNNTAVNNGGTGGSGRVAIYYTDTYSGTSGTPAVTNFYELDPSTIGDDEVESPTGIIRTIIGLTDISLDSGVDTGDGRDGDVTVEYDTNINRTNLISGRSCADGGDAVNYNITAFNSAGTEATLNRAPSVGCLSVGDEVLIINLQGTYSAMDNVGNYETLRIQSVTTTTVRFTTAKTKYYGNNLDDDTNLGTTANTQRVMLQRVPNYENLTVNSGVDFYPDEWATESNENSLYRTSKGGIMFFRASQEVNINGTVHADGKGYQGGNEWTDAGVDRGGEGGEAFCGPGGLGAVQNSDGSNGAAGGGGADSNGGNGYCGGGGGGDSSSTGGEEGSVNRGGAGGGGGPIGGGAGAGYGTPGSAGWRYTNNMVGEDGGTNQSGDGVGDLMGSTSYGGGGGGGSYGNPELTQLLMGSGGGKAGYYNSGSAIGGDGGDGAGVISIFSNDITISGNVTSNGSSGTAGTGSSYQPGGGGGAGGSILIVGATVNIGSTKVLASGGSGAAGTSNGGTGGDGGDGRIAVYYSETYSGTSGNPSVTNFYEGGSYSYGMYHSNVIPTIGAGSFSDFRWNFDNDTYGQISIQTRTGATTDPTDGSWEEWRPTDSNSANTTLQDADNASSWVGTNVTVSDGDTTRDIDFFEDEDEFASGNITKMISSTNGGYSEATISSIDLSGYDYITMWVKASVINQSLSFSMGESAGDEHTENIVIDSLEWQKVYWDITDIASENRNAITKLRITNLTSSTNTYYIDNVKAEILPTSGLDEIYSTPNDYLQYRVIFTTTDTRFRPTFSSISFTYNVGYEIVQVDSNKVRLYNYSGATQKLRLDVVTGGLVFELSQGTSASVNLSPSVAQVDSENSTNSIWINKTGTGGNLLKLQTLGVDSFVVGSDGNLTMTGDIEVQGGSIKLGSSGWVRFNESTNALEFTNDGTDWIALGPLFTSIVLSAEYSGAVLSADGTNNTGNMVSDSDATNNSMNYYEWNSSEVSLNDYDVRVRFTLPSNFGSWSAGGITFNLATESTNSASNKIDFYVYEESSGSVDGSSETQVSSVAGQWKSTTISGSGLTECVSAGDVCMLVIKMSSSNDNYVRVGDIEIGYDRKL